MIERLLGPPIVGVEAFGDILDEPVFPGEEDLLDDVVEARRREFVTARRCARTALGQLGFPPAPIRSGARREPLWPAGVVGSITHCAGYRAAAVAGRRRLAGIGIDGEPHDPLPADVARVVIMREERGRIAELDRAGPAVRWDRLLFSAKESIYKAWYPLTGRWLGFEDVHLTIDPVGQTFSGRLLVDGTRIDGAPPLTRIGGRWVVEQGLILTAAVVGASGGGVFVDTYPT